MEQEFGYNSPWAYDEYGNPIIPGNMGQPNHQAAFNPGNSSFGHNHNMGQASYYGPIQT